MATYEILIADDHPLFRSALHQAVTLGLGPDVRLVEVASIAELEKQLAIKADWDLVLLDLNMPGAYGFSGLVLLRGQYPQIPVVMVSAQEEASVMVRSREFGASGFIPKSSSLEQIQAAVRAVLDGDVSWPPQAFEQVQVSAEAKAASEGLASMVSSFIKQEFTRSPWRKLVGLFAYPVLSAFKKRVDHRRYNGAALLGLRGLVFKSHGSADAYAFRHALERAYDASRNQLLERVKTRIAHAEPLMAAAIKVPASS